MFLPPLFILDNRSDDLVSLIDQLDKVTLCDNLDDLIKAINISYRPGVVIISNTLDDYMLIMQQVRQQTTAPIILVLAQDASDDVIEDLMKIHLTDYITRPVNLAALRQRIRQVVRLADMETRNTYNRSIAELASDYVYTLRVQDDQTLIAEWSSEELTQLHGYPTDEMNVPNAWEKLIHPDERPLAQQRFNDLIQGLSRTDIFRMVARDGSIHWVEEYAQPIVDEETGKTSHIYGAGRNITAIKATEDKLRQVQETLQIALDATQTGIWDWDMRTDTVYYSPGWAKALGYTPDELTNTIETWRDRIHPDDAPIVTQALEAHFANGDTPYNIEHRLLNRNNDYHWVRARGRVIERDQENNPLRMVGVQIDIHDEKLMREKLAQNEERHRIISETISDYAYAYIVQDDGTLKKDWSTNAFHEITGYTFEEMDRNGWERLIHPEDREIGAARFQRLLSGEVDITEFRIITKFGETRWLRDHGYPIIDETTNRVIHIYGAAQDITEQKRYEAELQQRNEELDAFAYTVAHDLKNPISGIMGFASLVKNYFSRMTEDKVIEYLDLIMEAGYKLKDIINALLLLAGVNKIEHVEMSELDMQIIVDDTKRRLMAFIEEKGAIIQAPQDWPRASGYGPWVEEIWTNYISNALKYGGEPPEVVLGAEPVNDDMVRFFVRDNGMGLTEEEQNRVFTPFTRLNQVKVEGHGLGLSIVQRIVNKLGGEVGLESQPGNGSVFSFTLPKQHS
jgi:PAS domain S-box-containing protein